MTGIVLSAGWLGAFSLNSLSLTDLALIAVWILILVLYVGAQLLCRPWKGGSALRGSSNQVGSFQRPNLDRAKCRKYLFGDLSR
jgi:hypothetical protein